jgi:hypothetical protein
MGADWLLDPSVTFLKHTARSAHVPGGELAGEEGFEPSIS